MFLNIASEEALLFGCDPSVLCGINRTGGSTRQTERTRGLSLCEMPPRAFWQANLHLPRGRHGFAHELDLRMNGVRAIFPHSTAGRVEPSTCRQSSFPDNGPSARWLLSAGRHRGNDMGCDRQNCRLSCIRVWGQGVIAERSFFTHGHRVLF